MFYKLFKLKKFLHKLEWYIKYKRFSKDPFGIGNNPLPRDYYLQAAEKAKKNISEDFLKEIKDYFGNLPPNDFVDELALSTQIVKKKSELNYNHGYLLYSALCRYIKDNPNQNYTILETGTARGFSAVIMAKALDDANVAGKIITVDVLPHNDKIYWNCIHDAEGKKTRFELLEKWKDLVEKYIFFIQGYSDIVLKQLGFPRVHFAFIDGLHSYEGAKIDAEFVMNFQKKGDVIVFDDYTPDQLPGIVKLVDEIAESGKYSKKIFSSNSKRGYAYCVRN